MAVDQRLTERGVLPDPDAADLMHVVDISDLTGGASGTSKQATLQNIVLAGAGGSPENQIIINDVSDFAVQDATMIILEEGKNYVRGAAISTDKRFIVSKRVTISSPSFMIDEVWEYTGTEAMFTGLDVEFFSAVNLAVRCPDASEIFCFEDTSALNTSVISHKNCFAFSSGPSALAAKKWGTFTALNIVDMDVCVVSGASAGTGMEDGITLAGVELNKLSMNAVDFFTSENTFIGLDLGSVLIKESFRIDDLVIDGPSGATGISGLSSSANIETGIIAHIRDSEFLGSITPLSGITISDLRYEFLNCPPVEDSTKVADTFLTSPRSVGIAVQGVFVIVGGPNWSSDVTERFSVSSSGLITYLSSVTAKFKIEMAATETADNGDNINIAIGINGTAATKTITASLSSKASSLTSTGVFTLNENDTIQAYAANSTGSSNPTFDDFSMTLTRVT